jgi:hypothetical protein
MISFRRGGDYRSVISDVEEIIISQGAGLATVVFKAFCKSVDLENL